MTEPYNSRMVEKLAAEAGVGCCFIGWTGGDTIKLRTADRSARGDVTLADLKAASEGFFPKLMGAEAALA